MTYFTVCLIMGTFIAGAAGAINILTNSTSTSVTYGSSVRLICTINPIIDNGMFWIFGSQTSCQTGSGGLCIPPNREEGRLQFSTNIGNKEFYYDISNVQSSDSGTYTCKHGNSEETTIAVGVVFPIEYVTMTSPTTDTVTVVQNTDTPEFICVTSAGLPPASISWYLDNPSTTGGDVDITFRARAQTTTIDSNGLITTTSRLTYRPSKTYNGWRVYCIASNTAVSTHTSSWKPTLNVQFPPTVQLTTTHIVIEGTTLSIPCTITVGNPTATTYRWTRSIDGWSQTSSSMTLADVQTSDAAVYTCTATNTAGSGSGTYTLDVLFPPRTPTFRYRSSSVSGTFKFIQQNNADFLACTSSSNPTPTYTWQGPGGTTNSTNLALSGIQNNQGGVYTCTATNVMIPTLGDTRPVTGANSAQITLDVLYALSEPILRYTTITGTAITGTVNVVKEDTVPIACVATGNPPPSYTWTNPSYSGQILTKNNIQSDTTTRCTASSRMDPGHEAAVDQSETASVTVNVMYGPSEPVVRCIHCNPDIAIGSSVSIINGTSIHITCGESDSNPSATYSWSGAMTSTTGTLSYNSVSKAQAGDLTCTATNTMTRTFGVVQQGLNNKVVSLNILYKPTVGNMGNENIVELNEFSRTCYVTPGNPPPTTYRWTRSTDSGWSRTTRILTIPQLQREDTAVYTCTVQNTMLPTGLPQETGQDSNTFKLTTKYTPDVEVTTTNTTDSEGSAEILCVATGVPNVYTYQPWKQTWIDGTVINHEGGLDNIPTLRLSDLTYQHSGIYTCMVDNGVAGSRNPEAGQGHVYFVVKSKPVITRPVYNTGDHHKLSIGLNDPSSLDLEYYSNAGDTTVTVENGDQVIVVGTPTSTNIQLPVFKEVVSASGMTVTLTVNIESQSQFRRYEIVLQNAVNSVKFSLVVAPKQSPEVPTQLTSFEITETTAELTWIRGFHGGSDQTFVVQLSTDNINWTNKTLIQDGQKYSNTSNNITINNLSPGTLYFARVYSFNQEGRKQDASNVNTFTTTSVPSADDAQTASIGGIIGGAVAGVLVIILVVVAVVVARKYKCTCQKKMASSQSTEDSKKYYENVTENKVDNVQENEASEQLSYYNIGRESEPDPSAYESLSDREHTPNMYSSLQNIEMAPSRNIASDPAVSEPIQSQYESLTEREVAPNMYSSLANIESSPDGKVDLNPDQVYYNLKV